MLIEFSCSNFKSIKDKIEFSMEAVNSQKQLWEKNVFIVDERVKKGRYKLLKHAIIYGGNASGKSNILHAFNSMKSIIHFSSRTPEGEELNVQPFLLNNSTKTKPTRFEIIFLIGTTKYRYGFEATLKSITKEWLFASDKNNEELLFERKSKRYKSISLGNNLINDKSKEKILTEMTKENSLFLTICAQFNIETAKKITKWFSRFNILNGLSSDIYKNFTIKEFNNNKYIRSKIIELIKSSDVGINKINVSEFEGEVPTSSIPDEILAKIKKDNISENVKATFKSVFALHDIFDKNGNLTNEKAMFEFSRFESDGTKKLFLMSGPIIDTLCLGGVLAIDELGSSMHPLLTIKIIDLFSSPKSNPHNAQLILTTHDTNLLNKQLFRRDQIWFTEKDITNSTDLFSLVEFKGIRHDLEFERNYLKGNFGGIASPNTLIQEIKGE